MEHADCHFGKLSPELRNEVYSYLLPENQVIQLIPEILPYTDRRWLFNEVQPPITRLCKQLRSETKPMLYGNNKFIISVGDDVFGHDEHESVHGSVLRAAAWLRRNPAEKSPLKAPLVIAVQFSTEDWTLFDEYEDPSWCTLIKALRDNGYTEQNCVVEASLRRNWYLSRGKTRESDEEKIEALFRDMRLRCNISWENQD